MFWAPFFFLPLIASATVGVQPSGHQYVHALYAAVWLAIVGGYFRRLFLGFRLCLFLLLGFGAFIATGIALARLGYQSPTYLIIASIFDTNPLEASEFVNGTYGAAAYLLEAALLLPLVCLGIQWRKQLIWQPRNALPGIMSVLGLGLFLYHNGVLDSPLKSMAARLPEPLPLYFNIVPALQQRSEIAAIGTNPTPIIGATVVEPRREPRTYVVVIGEAESKYHMHLYGYQRPTTPQVDKMAANHELLAFSDVVTSHAETVPALTNALTVSIGQEKERRTIIDVLNAVGFKTYWLSNQSASSSGYDSAIALLSSSATEHKWLQSNGSGTVDRAYTVDGGLLPYLHDILTRKDEDKVVFVHLIGDHYDYQFRYPREEEKSFGRQNPNCFSSKEQIVVNQYDNAVHYTDSVLSRIIDATREIGGDSFVLYFSDHGEEVYEYRDVHDHDDDILSPYMADVPMLLSLSPGYRQNYPALTASATASINRPFWTGDLSYALADLTHVNFPGMELSRSIFSRQFKKRTRLTAGLDYDAFRAAWRPDIGHANNIKLNGCVAEAQRWNEEASIATSAISPPRIAPGLDARSEVKPAIDGQIQ